MSALVFRGKLYFEKLGHRVPLPRRRFQLDLYGPHFARRINSRRGGHA